MNPAILVTQVIDTPLSPTTDHLIDTVEIEWFEAARKIMRKTSQGQREVAFRLFAQNQALQHGDVIHQDAQLTLRIAIKPCECIVLRPSTLASMARVCYEIGNKHAPLFMDGDELLMPPDPPLFRWLEAAGYAPTMETRRLSHMLRSHSHGESPHAHPATHPKAPAWGARLKKA